jgi:hypothetical protein
MPITRIERGQWLPLLPPAGSHFAIYLGLPLRDLRRRHPTYWAVNEVITSHSPLPQASHRYSSCIAFSCPCLRVNHRCPGYNSARPRQGRIQVAASRAGRSSSYSTVDAPVSVVQDMAHCAMPVNAHREAQGHPRGCVAG